VLNHFVEESFVGQDALNHDGTDAAVGTGGISHISISMSSEQILRPARSEGARQDIENKE
jgi:hypothetical protein